MLQAPYYLAIGDVVVEDGSGSGPYHVYEMRLPAPAEDGRGGFVPAVRVFSVRVTGADPGAVSSSVAALRRQCVRDKLITLQSAQGRAMLTTRIREADVVEAEFDPLDRSVPSGPRMYLALTLTTDPHWLGPWSNETTVTVNPVPGKFSIPDPGGEDDALVSARIVPTATGRGLFLGAFPAAGAAFDPIDDYGTPSHWADPNALTGYKENTTITTAMGDVGTTPSIDTNANRGTYIPLVRLDLNATSQVRALQRVTGNAIAVSTDVPTIPVTPRSIELVTTELPRVTVPSGAVPDVASCSGWGETEVIFAQTDASGSLRVSAGRGALGDLNGELYFWQEYTASGELLNGFEFVVITPPTTTSGWWLDVIGPDGSTLRTATVPSMSAGNKKVVFDDLVTTNGMYRFQVQAPASAGYNDEYCDIDASTTSVYAGGSAGESFGGYANKDLTFKVYGKVQLGFASYTIVQASSSTGYDASIDYLVRVPVDYAAIAYRLATSAVPSLYYDGDTDTPYIADADGIGPSIYGQCEIIKPLRAKPGVSTTYVLAVLHDDVPPGSATVTYRTRPRYLSATG